MIAGVGNKNGNYDSSDIRQITLLMEGTWKIIQRRESEEKIKSYSKELAENNKELESLDRMKDEFMANITHELKTPLIPIKGYSELLFEGHLGSLDEDQRKGIGVILQNSERLHKLIDSLLYMQNIRSGNIQYHLDSINIVNVLDKVIDELLVFKDKEFPDLKKEYSSPLPFICGNTTYLEQVFSHILENALKFTPSDGLITVVASHEGKNIRITVRDTGIGISQEEMPNIFKRFYQVDGSLTRRYGGNGLGLYLCKSVVEAHGGSIHAVSEVGNGTEIHVLLPIIEE
jgi:signal transduction histidine kinase